MSDEEVKVASNGVKPDQPYQLLPTIEGWEFEQLKASIREAGGLWPGFEVDVDEDGRILDGHSRSRACAEVGVECPTRVRHFASEADKVRFVLRANLSRRHLTLAQKREAARQLLAVDPAVSNSSVARDVGLTDKTVAAVRERLEESSEIPTYRATGGRGITTAREFVRCDLCDKPLDPRKAISVNGSGLGHEECIARLEQATAADDHGAPDNGSVAADHRSMAWAELTINYPAPSAKERTRKGLPYARESERREWFSERLWLQAPAPTTERELIALMTEIGNRCVLEARERPLLTMVAAEAAR